jgi:hypothetical protein
MTANQVLHFVQDDRAVCHPEGGSLPEGSVFDSCKTNPDSSLALRMTANQVLHFVQDDRAVCHPEEPQATNDLGLTLKAWNQILH